MYFFIFALEYRMKVELKEILFWICDLGKVLLLT